MYLKIQVTVKSLERLSILNVGQNVVKIKKNVTFFKC